MTSGERDGRLSGADHLHSSLAKVTCVTGTCKSRAMSIEATHDAVVTSAAPAQAVIHPLWVRVTHWINALAMLVMIGSGWQIYDASPLPLFRFEFPTSITLGGTLPTGLAWHFAAMWLLAANGLVYVGLGLASGRFRAKLFP